MHRKTSNATERLLALRALIVRVATRIGVAPVQILAAALTHVRGMPVAAVRALAFVRTLRANDVRTAVQSLVRRRGAVAGFAYASALTLVLVAGSAVLTQSEAPGPPSVAVADAQDRLAAAERADRSSRTDVAPPADATPAPESAAAPVLAAPAQAWVSPMPGAAVSSCYGPRWGTTHRGMDFAGPNGTPILASGGGIVFGVGWLYSGYGMSVVIDHGNGYFTHYAHSSRIDVAVGQQVTTGQIIAWEGSTGNSTGPHLHFEVHQGLWNQVNPAQFLRDRGALIGC